MRGGVVSVQETLQEDVDVLKNLIYIEFRHQLRNLLCQLPQTLVTHKHTPTAILTRIHHCVACTFIVSSVIGEMWPSGASDLKRR